MSENGDKQKGSDGEAKGEIVWDDYHCNPRAEVVLVSADMVGFRVDAFYISKKSDFIKVLLTLPSAQSISDAPIHLSQNADIVRHYVDYVTSSKAHDTSLDMDGFQNLLDLCDQLQWSAIETFVLGAIKARMDRREYPKDFDPGAFLLLPRDVTMWLWPSARYDNLVISIFETYPSSKRLRSTTTFQQYTSKLCFDVLYTPTPRIRPGSRIPVTAFVSCL